MAMMMFLAIVASFVLSWIGMTATAAMTLMGRPGAPIFPVIAGAVLIALALGATVLGGNRRAD